MEQNITIEALATDFPQVTVTQGSQFVTLTAPLSQYRNVMQTLKEKYHFNFLVNMTGVDEMPALALINHLRNTATNQMIVVRTATDDRNTPAIDSLAPLWPAAIYFEREVFDLLGIHFNDHPDMRRLFLEDDYPGFPLRKDFIDPFNSPENK